MLTRILGSSSFQTSLLAPPARAVLRALNGIMQPSLETQIRLQTVPRGHYAYCMLHAARLGRALGMTRISAIEFGVAGGNGLAEMCRLAEIIRTETGVTIDCYGFDTGAGMPEPEDALDLPYWFRAKQYAMDIDALKAKVPNGKLVIGDITETIGAFVAEQTPAPIGVIFNDTDYLSSTRESFRLFDAVADHPECFLPRIFAYFDDIIGSEIEMYGPYNGQLRAIEDFNAAQDDVKVHRNQNLLKRDQFDWRWQIYYFHLFRHPQYETYIGGEDQDAMEARLKLKS